MKRAITGAIFAIVLIGGMPFCSISFFILFLTITVLGIREFYQLVSKQNIKPQKLIGILSGAFIFIASFVYASQLFDYRIFLPIVLLFIAIPVIEMYRKQENPFTNI